MKAYLISGVVLAMLAGAADAQPTAPGAAGAASGAVGAQSGAATKAPTGRAAHIILQDGDAMVDVKCADDESMKTCAEITLQILDKLVALPKP